MNRCVIDGRGSRRARDDAATALRTPGACDVSPESARGTAATGGSGRAAAFG